MSFAFISRSNIRIEYIGMFILDYRANDDGGEKHCYFQYTDSRLWPFDWGIFTFDLASFQRSRSCTYRRLTSHKRWLIGQTLPVPTNRRSYTAFPLTYLYLTIVNSKDQGQGHAQFSVKKCAKTASAPGNLSRLARTQPWSCSFF